MPVEPPAAAPHRPPGGPRARPPGRAGGGAPPLAVPLAGNGPPPAALQAATLPPPWKVSIDVLNGSGDINYTRRVASRVGSFGYRIQHVPRADRLAYSE